MKIFLAIGALWMGLSTNVYCQDLASSIAKISSGKYFEREKIKFDSKYLEDFSFATHQGKTVILGSTNRGISLKRDHPFVIALRWNADKVTALLEIPKHDKYSQTFFKHLKKLLNEKGRAKYIGYFKNGNDQQSQFRRRAIIDELEKKSTISELLFVAQNVSAKGVVSFVPKKLPTYNFDKEEFIFNFIANGRICPYVYKISTQEASLFASSWTIYWEASTIENNNTFYQVFLGDFPPNSPRFTFSSNECN